MAIAILLGLVWPAPPAPAPASAPASEFSAERALAHLRVIAAAPHPTGTRADDAVRDYLIAQLRALGFAVDVQETTSVTDDYARRPGGAVVAAHVRNVIARRAGTAGGPAVALMAHYDSRELAPGASDDGFGTAALLETARALAASAPLRHDVLIVLTEGEEQGLMGARAFFAESPAAPHIAVALEFEARGDAGPVLMFQTSEGAAGLVDALARAAPHVVASSLSQEVYRRMPNDTDLTIALRRGIPSMNFAGIGGFERYHQSTDTIENASAATLQHHGDYALALARAFGDAEPMVPPARGDEVYFDLGPFFVHYGAAAALPGAIVVIAVALAAAAIGVRRRKLRPAGVLAGTGLVVIAPAAAATVASAASWLGSRLGAGALATQEARAGLKSLYEGAFALLGLAVCWLIVAGAAAPRRLRPAEIATAAAIVWAALAVVCAGSLPGASFLVTWPAAALAIASLIGSLAAGTAPAGAAHGLAAIVAALVLAPTARQLGVVFGTSAAPGIGGIAGLAATAVFPLLEAMTGARRWTLPAAAAASGVAMAAVALSLAPHDASYPRPDSIVYALDADAGHAWWLSTDGAPDAWTSSVLAGAQPAPSSDPFPLGTRPMLRAPAPMADVGRPSLETASDERRAASRSLHVRLRLPAGTEAFSLRVAPAGEVTAARVDGRPFPVATDGGWLALAYFGPPEAGVDLELETSSPEPVALRVVSQRRGLPPELRATLGPRPPDRMPAVAGWNALRASDMTLVAATLRVPAP